MKSILNRILYLSLLLSLFPSIPLSSRAEDAVEQATPEPRLFSDSDLDILLGPIALYPDPLLAVLLPAATHPVELVVAVRYLDNGGDLAQIENQNWSDSVQALAHYPEVIRWMDENLEWTTQLGNAFVAQPEDVIAAIQRLRALAQSLGNLQTTNEQLIENEDGAIDITPIDAETIYQPAYDPYVIFTRASAYGAGPYMTFPRRLSAGNWLKHDWDWRNKRIVIWQTDNFRPQGWWRQPCKTRFTANYKFTEWSPKIRRGQPCSKFWTARGATGGHRPSSGAAPAPVTRTHANGTVSRTAAAPARK
ncbi:MAG TPA: DUF3300 domain-containing protein [Verrucomicrobiae bacterium]|nr:DUF3300 domain-containing protein [Verrucomicrobiae bacterium]